VLITLTPADPTCVNIPATVLIPGGLTSADVFVEAGSAATLPCSTVINATGPEGFTPDAITANVAAVPGIATTAAVNLGAGLQRQASFTLGSPRHGGTTVTVTSPDPQRVLIAPNLTTPGTASVEVNVNIGATGGTFVVQTLEGTFNDTLAVTVSAPAFNDGTMQVRIWQPVFDLGNVANGTTILADRNIYVTFGTPSTPTGTFINTNDQIRAGGVPQVFSIINDSLPVVDLVTQQIVADSVTVTAQPGTSNTPTTLANNGAAIRYVAEGTATLRATHPTYRPLAGAVRNLTVTQPSISALSAFTMLGYGLQRTGQLNLSSAAPEGGVQVTLTVDRADRVLLAPSASVVGVSDTLVVTINEGGSFANFVVQALEGSGGDTLTLRATAPGFTERTSTISLTVPVYDITGWLTSATTALADRPLRVTIGSPNSPTGTFININDNLRAGAEPRPVTVVTDSTAYGTLVTLAGTADSIELSINALQGITPSGVAGGGMAYRYLAEGTGQVRASVPGMRALAGAERFVTITQPSISALSTLNVGSGLQRAASVSLSSAVADEPVVITITSETPNRLLFAPSAGVVGTDTIQLTINPGSASIGFVVQALEDIEADTVTIRATAPGYTERTSTVRIWQPVIDITSLANTTTTLTADDPFVARIGTPSSPNGNISTLDVLRAGAPARTVTFEVSPTTNAQLVTTATTASVVTAVIPASGSSTPGTVATGGVAFRPLAVGTAVVTAASPGFHQTPTAAGFTVTINPPTITLNAIANVGAGLQRNVSGSLSASQHGGVAVTIRSSNPAVARVAPNASTVGAEEIVLNLANGVSSFSYTVSGVEGTTGTVTISASAQGFVDGSNTATIVEPALSISGLAASGTAGVTADDPFNITVGIPNTTLTGLTTSLQVRAGSSLTVTLTSSNPTAAPLVTLATPDGAGSVTVTIAGGSASAPTTVATGGVALRFAAPGSTAVNASAAGAVQITPSTVNVTVNAP